MLALQPSDKNLPREPSKTPPYSVGDQEAYASTHLAGNQSPIDWIFGTSWIFRIFALLNLFCANLLDEGGLPPVPRLTGLSLMVTVRVRGSRSWLPESVWFAHTFPCPRCAKTKTRVKYGTNFSSVTCSRVPVHPMLLYIACSRTSNVGDQTADSLIAL